MKAIWLWDQGYDTKSISEWIGVPESVVERWVHEALDERREATLGRLTKLVEAEMCKEPST